LLSIICEIDITIEFCLLIVIIIKLISVKNAKVRTRAARGTEAAAGDSTPTGDSGSTTCTATAGATSSRATT
jgi:hypothetical protein